MKGEGRMLGWSAWTILLVVILLILVAGMLLLGG